MVVVVVRSSSSSNQTKSHLMRHPPGPTRRGLIYPGRGHGIRIGRHTAGGPPCPMNDHGAGTIHGIRIPGRVTIGSLGIGDKQRLSRIQRNPRVRVQHSEWRPSCAEAIQWTS